MIGRSRIRVRPRRSPGSPPQAGRRQRAASSVPSTKPRAGRPGAGDEQRPADARRHQPGVQVPLRQAGRVGHHLGRRRAGARAEVLDPPPPRRQTGEHRQPGRRGLRPGRGGCQGDSGYSRHHEMSRSTSQADPSDPVARITSEFYAGSTDFFRRDGGSMPDKTRSNVWPYLVPGCSERRDDPARRERAGELLGRRRRNDARAKNPPVARPIERLAGSSQ